MFLLHLIYSNVQIYLYERVKRKKSCPTYKVLTPYDEVVPQVKALPPSFGVWTTKIELCPHLGFAPLMKYYSSYEVLSLFWNLVPLLESCPLWMKPCRSLDPQLESCLLPSLKDLNFISKQSFPNVFSFRYLLKFLVNFLCLIPLDNGKYIMKWCMKFV